MDDNFDLSHQRVYDAARKSRDFGRTFVDGNRLITIHPKDPGIPLTPALENDLLKLRTRDNWRGYDRLMRKHRSTMYRWYRAFLSLFSRSRPGPVVFGHLDPDAAFHRDRF